MSDENLEQELAAAAIDLMDLQRDARFLGAACIIAAASLGALMQSWIALALLGTIGFALLGASRALHIWERQLAWQEDQLRKICAVPQHSSDISSETMMATDRIEVDLGSKPDDE